MFEAVKKWRSLFLELKQKIGDYATMSNDVIAINENPKDLLSRLLREGAQRMLAEAINLEVTEYLTSANKNQLVVTRNGKAPKRQVQTGLGPIEIQRPKLRTKPGADTPSFSSKVLPPYLRKTKSVEQLIPWLYLKGISANDMASSLEPLLGKHLHGFSAASVCRLKESWTAEYEKWNKSPIDERIIYVWADGVYFDIRLGEDERMCVLVVIGATSNGEKKLLGIEAGYRESTVSWKNLLLKLRDRGLNQAPELAIGDGAMGFWAAIDEVFPQTRHQRCWVHRTANVLDALPKSKQTQAKTMIHEIYRAESKLEAEKAFKRFVDTFDAKYPGAVKKLLKTKESTMTFYDFPAEHWSHIRGIY